MQFIKDSLYQKQAASLLTNNQDGFSPEEYSEFKFGSSEIIEKYAKGIAEKILKSISESDTKIS
jgi:hypothetical protein